jgi:diguanylate cyclase (GGDEF)-like protein/PAS domain S-box-containing protein
MPAGGVDGDPRTAFDHAPTGVAILTPQGVVTACNAAMGELLGADPPALVGSTFFDVTHPDDLPAAKRSCELIQTGGHRTVRHECRFVRPDGSVVWVSISTSRVPPDEQRPARLVMHIDDVSERKALEARLAHLATHDPLTGLPNRSLLDERIDRVLAEPPDGTASCLLYLDLDGFKVVNDRFGHAVGDAVLRELAGRIVELLDEADTAARLGGDEFAVLCVGGGADRGERLAERLRAAVARPFVVDGRAIALSAAVGVSATSEPPAADHPTTRTDLLVRADERMYRAKRRRTTG